MSNKCYTQLYPEHLKLEGITGEFYLGANGTRPMCDDDIWNLGDEYIASYYNSTIDCQLVLTEIRMLDEYVDEITVCVNAIEDDIYNFICKELSNKGGLRIWITQVGEECSDVIIVYDYFGDGTAITVDLMEHLINKAQASKYKYLKIQYGRIEPLSRRMKC